MVSVLLLLVVLTWYAFTDFSAGVPDLYSPASALLTFLQLGACKNVKVSLSDACPTPSEERTRAHTSVCPTNTMHTPRQPARTHAYKLTLAFSRDTHAHARTQKSRATRAHASRIPRQRIPQQLAADATAAAAAGGRRSACPRKYGKSCVMRVFVVLCEEASRRWRRVVEICASQRLVCIWTAVTFRHRSNASSKLKAFVCVRRASSPTAQARTKATNINTRTRTPQNNTNDTHTEIMLFHLRGLCAGFEGGHTFRRFANTDNDCIFAWQVRCALSASID